MAAGPFLIKFIRCSQGNLIYFHTPHFLLLQLGASFQYDILDPATVMMVGLVGKDEDAGGEGSAHGTYRETPPSSVILIHIW